jgi:hypothetical protein
MGVAWTPDGRPRVTVLGGARPLRAAAVVLGRRVVYVAAAP